MFNLFGRRTAKELIEDANATYGLPEPVKVPTMPATKTKQKYKQELFRVGATPEGLTTLTLIDDGGFSMTLSLDQKSCEQMIRMLQSTFKENTNVDN